MIMSTEQRVPHVNDITKLREGILFNYRAVTRREKCDLKMGSHKLRARDASDNKLKFLVHRAKLSALIDTGMLMGKINERDIYG